jgi:hypothetical protein
MNFFEQFTPEQMQAQYFENYKGLVRLRDKAFSTGKKVNGYTHEELKQHAILYKKLAGL